jgi:hypothetical protein
MLPSHGSALRTFRDADGAFLLPGAIPRQCGTCAGPVQPAAKSYVRHAAGRSFTLQNGRADSSHNTAHVAWISSGRVLVLFVSYPENLENLRFSHLWHRCVRAQSRPDAS